MQLSDVLNISNPYSEPSPLYLRPCEPNKNIIEAKTREIPFQFKANKEPLPPIMPTKWSKNIVKEMKKTPIEKWKWTSFRNNARKDHLELHHWEKISKPQSHYPFSEYDKAIEPVHYADDEYQECISSDGWTKEQTDHLFELCSKYDLRWPIISDRYSLLPYRTEEECKYRYYSVCKKILSHRKARNFTLTPFQESILNYNYDQEYDIERNRQFDKLFKISKLEELEIHKLENELNVIESLIKEIVYNDITSSNTTLSNNNNLNNNNNNNKSFNKRHRNMKSNSIIDEFITDSELNEYIKNPNNMLLLSSQHPFYQPLLFSQQQLQQNQQSQQQLLQPGVVLRSQRFEVTSGKSGVLSSILKVVQSIMGEFGIPPKMTMATDKICNLYDQIKQKTIKLIVLQRHVALRESALVQAEESQNLSQNIEAKKRKPPPLNKPRKKVRQQS